MTPPGIGGGAVRVLPVGALEAWVSTVADRALRATVQAVREHDAVVSAALATGRTPLPARFGQSWPSDAACVASVTQRAAELESQLRGVAGLVEMTVCTLLPGIPPATRVPAAARDEAAPGSAYLRQLRARADRERHLRTALEALRARVSRSLGSLSRGEVAEIRGNGGALALSVSYLIERGGVPHFRRAVDEVAREAAARLVVAGPRAPYSFAPASRAPGRVDAARPANRS
ncbi:MAG: GvpL/GvpF family gas vesicle protein [Gemmatimonadota bacterium]|nr:GvpL/GvpF family gas vesicle protein [Gemmatimonadota bacterium]